jgi:hypothetical protein
MNPTTISRLHAALAGVCLAASPLLAATPSGTVEKGDLWQVTTQMSMEGMDLPMGPQSNTVCSDRGWSRPPVGTGDRDCQVSNVVNTPSKTSWTMTCSGAHAMKGEGEIQRTGPDDYTGTMKMIGAEGTFLMRMKGHKIGECDVAAVRQERADTIARVQAQADAATQMQADTMVTMCNGVADALDLMTLTVPGGPCGDPAYKTRFCTKFQTRDGLDALAGRPAPYGVDAAASYCGADVAAMKQKYCAEAVPKQDYAYLAKACPAEVEAIAKKECPGRDGTTFYATPLGQLCSAYAKDTMSQENQAKPETKKEKSKKFLKGIFP